MAHDVALAIVALGTAITMASCLAVARYRDAFDRLHLLTPITSLGCPLVAIGLSVEQGWGLTTGSLLLVAGLLYIVGPPLEAATARLMGQIEGKVSSASPE